MNLRSIIAVIFAFIGGYFVLKLIWWLFTLAFSIAITIVQIVFILIIAVPLFFIIRRVLS